MGKGMIGFSEFLNVESSEAIRAYIISEAHAAASEPL